MKELLGNPELNVAELAVELDKYFIDRQPSDIRWHSEDPSAFTKGMTTIGGEGGGWLSLKCIYFFKYFHVDAC